MDPGEPSEVLAGLIETLVDEKDLRESMGRVGRMDVKERYQLDRFGRDYTRLYESVAAVDWSIRQ